MCRWYVFFYFWLVYLCKFEGKRHFPNRDWYLVLLPQAWPSLCLRTLHCLSFQMKMDLDLSWHGSDAAWLLFRKMFVGNEADFEQNSCCLEMYEWLEHIGAAVVRKALDHWYFFLFWTRHNPYSTTRHIGTLQKKMHYFPRINGTLKLMAWNTMKIQNHTNTWYKKPLWQVVTSAVMRFRRVSNTAWKHPMVGSQKMEVGWFWN